MSAIGEYVHLTGEGYAWVGLSRPHQHRSGGSAAVVYSAQKAIIRNKIKAYSKLGRGELMGIETNFNVLLERLGQQATEDTVSSTDLMVNEAIFKLLEDNIKQFQSINFTNGFVNYIPGPIKGFSSAYKSWKDRLPAKINEINTALKQLERLEDGASPAEIKTLIAELNKIVTDTYEKTYQNIVDGKYVNKKSRTTKNLIREINELIDVYNSLPYLQNDGNELLRSIVGHVPGTAKAAATRVLAKELTMNIKDVDVSVAIENNNQSTVTQLGEITQKVNSNDDSINIGFSWGTKQIIVKAHKPQLKGRNAFPLINENISLLTIISEAGDNFANHYLNLFSHHEGKSAMNSFVGNRQGFQEVVKLMALYKAFENAPNGKDKVYFYIVGKQVKIVSMYSVLEKVIDNPEKFSVMTDDDSLSRMKLFSNQRGPDIEGKARINQLLQDIRTQKLRVSIRSSTILGLDS